MVRILQVLPTLNVCGGVENYLMNYVSRLYEEIVCDYAVNGVEDGFFKEQIEKKGGKIFIVPPFSLSGLKASLKKIEEIFQENQYDIVHSHQANSAWFYFSIAKKYGVKHRILHSHQAAAADKWTHKLRNLPLLFMGKRYTTDNFACSRLAGDYLFKKKPYTVINNAVNVSAFSYNLDVRNEVRKELNVSEDEFLIGHIGRFCNQKNQPFLLEIFQEIAAKNERAKLLLVGGGETKAFCEKRAKELGIGDKVIFTGVRTDAKRLYQAMDVFVLPSLYEGLPVVGVEAQAAGLPLLLSDRVTKETKILPSTEFIPLRSGVDIWAKKVLSFEGYSRQVCDEQVKQAGFDIDEEGKKLSALYKKIAEGGKE